jgi:TPR repeat protein
MIQLDETGQGRGSGGRSRYSSGSTDRRRDAEQWNQAGDAGDATAKYQLGLMYQNGWGVPQDQAQRQRWFQAAAQLGHPQAQLALADMLEAALDYQQALGWYQQAAAAKQAVACACLGRFYGLGLGTPKDDFLDLFWTITAADLGQTDALARLALFAVAEPDRLLMACLKKAAAAGIADAQYALGKHFETVNRPEFDIQAAIRNYQSAAQQGHALAQFCLGLIYSEGKGVRKDMTLAQNWFTLAANQNDAKAQWNLSLLLISGTDGLKKDLKKAFLLCEKAAIQGFVPAQASLGILYAKMKKPQKAAEWWQLAAEQGDPEAQFNLSLAYSNGLGVAKDAASAINWLIKAAEQGVVTAQSKLGLLYATGSGVALDSIEAHKWFLIASEKGDKAAQANLQHSESQIGKMQKAEAIRRCRAWTPFVH